jgi:hypothetical protein
VISPVRVVRARVAFFLDVDDFPAPRDLDVTADDATAGESGETEKPDEAHDNLLGTDAAK